MMGIFLIASASASDLNESMSLESDTSIEDVTVVLAENENNQSVSSFDEGALRVADDEVIATNYTPRTVGEIQSCVDNANSGDTIVLDGYYLINSTISVGKQLNFVGVNNATIDGNSKVRLFSANSQNIIFNNITFKNGYSDYGGAIAGGCKVINCTFLNNSASRDGGALSGGSASNCNFFNNSARNIGGAMNGGSAVNCIFSGNFNLGGLGSGGALYGGTAVNCTFINNYVSNYNGGAVLMSNVLNCTFINNSAKNGGAMYGGSAVNCTFINNSANEYGGALYYSNAENCTFINNSAKNGGAMYGGSAVNCTFINNSANEYGGAMSDGNAYNCIFINNAAGNVNSGFTGDGGAMSGGTAVNCIFMNNFAWARYGTGGGAIYRTNAVNCTFINNSARNNGAAIYGGNAVNCSFINHSRTAVYETDAVNCTFINNSGAMYNRNAINCTFINNSDVFAAIFGASNVVNCTFINNSAGDNGGAIDVSKNVVNCTFINNSADGNGGAISRADNIVNCTFINNSAGGNGGAIFNCNALNCRFINCSADYGGAIYLNNNLNITYCEFINCSAEIQGGAIYWNQSANVTCCNFANCTSSGDNSCLASNSSQGDYLVRDCIFDEYPTNIDYHYVSSLFADNLTYFNGEEGIVTAGLCDIRGALTGRVVTISIEGNEYNATTNSNGLASFNIDAYLNKAGIYNATIGFDGDNILYSASVNITVTINRHTAILNADDLILFKNEYGTILANLSNIRGPLKGKRVTFTLNGVNRQVTTDANGVAEFKVLNYVDGKGEYAVEIGFAGDDFNLPASINISFLYIDYKGNLTGSVDGKYFNDTILSFNLVNFRNNNPIPDAPIRLVFSNGVVVNLTTDVDGNVNYRIPFSPDYYDVTASVVGEYVSVNNVTISDIEINKLFGTIQHSLLNGNKTVRFKLSSKYNDDVFRNVRLNLVFSNGEKAEIITDKYGIASYDIPFPKGTYSVSATVNGAYQEFDPDPDYISNIVITNDLNCSINFTNDIVFDFGEYGSTNFTVDGGRLDRDNISVLNHSDAIIGLSGNTITVFGLSVGKYVLMVETTPDDYHNPVTAMLNITVNNVKSKVNLKTGVVFAYGSSASIHVTVDGGIVEQKNIRILNHPEAGISFSGSVITISGLNVGNYVLSVTSTPDSDHTPATSNVTVTVNKATAVITAQKVTVALKKGSLWSITLVDSTNKRPIANMKLTLKVYTGKKFKTVTVTTNSKGVATYQTRGLSKGTHKIVISAFDANYDFNTMTSSIKVIKQKALKFKVKVKNEKDGSSLSITVKHKNKPLNGVKIRLYVYSGKKLVKKVTLKSKTASQLNSKSKKKFKGCCGWGTNKLSAGKHKIVIKPVDIKYGGSKKVNIKIKKSAKNKKKYARWETII